MNKQCHHTIITPESNIGFSIQIKANKGPLLQGKREHWENMTRWGVACTMWAAARHVCILWCHYHSHGNINEHFKVAELTPTSCGWQIRPNRHQLLAATSYCNKGNMLHSFSNSRMLAHVPHLLAMCCYSFSDSHKLAHASHLLAIRPCCIWFLGQPHKTTKQHPPRGVIKDITTKKTQATRYTSSRFNNTYIGKQRLSKFISYICKHCTSNFIPYLYRWASCSLKKKKVTWNIHHNILFLSTAINKFNTHTK